MKHFKNPATGELFAYDSDGSQDTYIDPALVPVTDQEAQTMRDAMAPKPTRAEIVRARLAAIDVDSIRALRATMAATAKGRAIPAFDANKLDTLETEATTLRAELQTLRGTP